MIYNSTIRATKSYIWQGRVFQISKKLQRHHTRETDQTNVWSKTSEDISTNHSLIGRSGTFKFMLLGFYLVLLLELVLSYFGLILF